MIRLESGSATLVGQVRSANEDSLLVTDDLVAVADGMGGHRAGEVASATTVEVLATMAGHRSLADLVLAVHMANRNINDRADADEDLRGMGTTVCVVGLVDEDGEHLAVLNVGDSRVYLHADGELRRLTEDHSLVETLVAGGPHHPGGGRGPPAAQRADAGARCRGAGRGRRVAARTPARATGCSCAATDCSTSSSEDRIA